MCVCSCSSGYVVEPNGFTREGLAEIMKIKNDNKGRVADYPKVSTTAKFVGLFGWLACVFVRVCGVVWCGVVWCGVVWCGVVCCVVLCCVVLCCVVLCCVVLCCVVLCVCCVVLCCIVSVGESEKLSPVIILKFGDNTAQHNTTQHNTGLPTNVA